MSLTLERMAKLPIISADGPEWLKLVRAMAQGRREFLLVDVTTKEQMAQVVDLIVEHRLWIEACGESFLVSRLQGDQ